MTASSNLFADDCASTCATANCQVIGQIAQPGDEVGIYLPGDAATVAVQIEDKGTGTLGFQMSVDGINWVPCEMYAQPGDNPVTATTADGLWRGSVAGMSKFRVVSGDDYAGTMATVSIRVSPADLFVDTDVEHANDPVMATTIEVANIAIAETGGHQIVAGVADTKVRIHRLKLSANELALVRFYAFDGVTKTLLSGWETCDVQLLDFDPIYPWYTTPDDAGFFIEVLMSDGGGAPPDVEPLVVGGTVWFSRTVPPVIFP